MSIGNDLSPAELEAKALASLENPPAPVVVPPVVVTQQDVTPPASDPVNPPDPVVTDPPTDLPPQNPPDVTPPASDPVNPPAPAAAQPVDYEARYKGSTRENEIIRAKHDEVSNAISNAATLQPPTDEEMKAIYGDAWELMDDIQKNMARSNELNERRFKLINEANEKTRQVDAWVKKVSDYVTDPEIVKQYPKIVGHEDEFKLYATKPTHIGAPLDLMIKAFVSDIKENKPARRSIFVEPGGGRGGSVKVDDKVTLEQAGALRTSNPKEYEKLVRAGKIAY